MSLKCASCGGTAGVTGFCVETNQVLCKKCVGLQTYPGLKGNEWTFEQIDTGHAGVQTLTVIIVNVSLLFFLGVTLLRSGVSDDYFAGTSMCPALGTGRQALARFDANLFYYYKSSLATYCDIEDSFWRLLMDGWVRGVVSGSDTLLLLLSTLPKAFLFKTAVSTFLRPVYAVLYATCGMTLGLVIYELEDLVFKITGLQVGAAPAAGSGGPPPPAGASVAGTSKVAGLVKQVIRLPARAKIYIFTKWSFFQQGKLLLWGWALSMALRLIVHAVGLETLAGTNHVEVSIWQLAFEPVCFWYLGVCLGNVQAKLDKTIWKKAPPSTTHPMTLWRERPMKNIVELLSYARGRMTRSWVFYKQKAESLIHILFDDVFNGVVVLRLVGILFSLAPLARTMVEFIGLGGIMERHSAWVMAATGFTQVDQGRYLTDKLAAFGFAEATMVSKVLMAQSTKQVKAHFEWNAWSVAVFLVWRCVIPLIFFQLEKRWAKLIDQQTKDFKKQWQGEDWKDGCYAAQNQKYGSFWNQVVKKEDWQAPLIKAAAAKKAEQRWSKVKTALTAFRPKKE